MYLQRNLTSLAMKNWARLFSKTINVKSSICTSLAKFPVESGEKKI